MKKNEDNDFVDQLMDRVFNFKAPPMPDFKNIDKEVEVIELDFNQLSLLNAAGEATPGLADLMKNKKDLPPSQK